MGRNSEKWVIDNGLISAMHLTLDKGEVSSSEALCQIHFCWRDEQGGHIDAPKKKLPCVTTRLPDMWPDKWPGDADSMAA